MVCVPVGLLDDAIREHLELKRRRGADPGEIAHQEHAALDPVYPAEAPAEGADVVVAEADPEPAPTPAESSEAGADPVAAAQLGEETAEIDMQAVLGAEDAAAEPHAAPARAAASERPLNDDAFEWEMPGEEGAERIAEPGPGQERMSFE